MTTTITYDAPRHRIKPVNAIGQRTNMTYDPGPHEPEKADADEPAVVKAHPKAADS